MAPVTEHETAYKEAAVSDEAAQSDTTVIYEMPKPNSSKPKRKQRKGNKSKKVLSVRTIARKKRPCYLKKN